MHINAKAFQNGTNGVFIINKYYQRAFASE